MTQKSQPLPKSTNLHSRINPFEIGALLILAVAVFGLYANTLDDSFHLDDERVIWDNPAVFMRAFTWDNLVRAGFDSKIKTRPVSHISFALNYYFHQLNVQGYHIVNIIIHIITGLLLFFLIKATLSLPHFKNRYQGSALLIISFVTAALWLCHPLQTQSVSYVVQRMNSMASMFYILAMLLYVKARLSPAKKIRWALFGGCVLAGILALGSKENAATLPLFIVLYEWYFLQDMQMSFVKRYAWMIGIVAVLFIIIALVYMKGDPIGRLFTEYDGRPYSLMQKLLTESRVVILYITLVFFPHPNRLNLDYDFIFSRSLISPGITILSVVILAALLAVGILAARRNRLLSFGILWFLGNLVIESSFIPLELVFEHRVYLPSMFIILLIVMALYRLFDSKKIFYAVCLMLLVILPYWTFERNRVWHDELTLWQDCLKKSPNKWRVHNNIGKEYFRRWETDLAIFHYQKALQFAPNDPMPRMNLASALAMQERHQEAIIQLQIVLSKDPKNQKAWEHLQNNKRFLKWKRQK